MDAKTFIESFIETPRKSYLDSCTKETLLEIASHYRVPISDKERKLKERFKLFLIEALREQGVLLEEPGPKPASVVEHETVGLTFEQRRELLQLQIEQEKLRWNSENSRIALEKAKLDLELRRLDLIKDGKLGMGGSKEVSSSLHLVPQFNDQDPDVFFTLFERVADTSNWADEHRCLLLQCVLQGKAQEAYSSLPSGDSKVYSRVKAAVLRAYELVPEAYRLRFWQAKKEVGQTHLELARELRKHFTRWCSASEVKTFDDLSDLMLVEQFKSVVPERVATYISELKAKTPEKAVELADEFTLIHKGSLQSVGNTGVNIAQGGNRPFPVPSALLQNLASDVCNYCHEIGHWKVDCPAVKKRPTRSIKYVKPNALVGPFHSIESAKHSLVEGRGVANAKDCLLSYLPFITDGCVFFPGQPTVPVKILRDTGAVDSFILQSVLPFNEQSYTGESVLIRGIGLNTVSVPLHRLHIQSDFVQGEVIIGVRPALPVEGVHVILGNGIAGCRVWGDVPAPVVCDSPIAADCVPSTELNSSCAVTRSRSAAEPGVPVDGRGGRALKGMCRHI
ncbi:hypothetical protein ACEWY4_009471 [Coilia grayii]|uniref:CCHC-type domain-containing protein n=1 Tax=Coilia grayii TaxID=363190 RepID=A0ABD1K6I1_9TELE